MSLNNHIIIIPGLGNRVDEHVWATRSWGEFGIIPHVFDTRWQVEEKGFPEKLGRLLELVDSLSRADSRISIIGNSAGSSLALNLFAKRKRSIDRIIINCGRVREGDWPWFTFNQATARSPSFKDSVLHSQKNEGTLTPDDRRKILTIRPLFDEVVPPTTITIPGAINRVIPTIEHSFTIMLTMTILRKQIIDFVR